MMRKNITMLPRRVTQYCHDNNSSRRIRRQTRLRLSPIQNHHGLCSLLLLLLLLLCQHYAVTHAESQFNPYQLNGGLVAAVAAKDYVVVASDTRFMGEGGYDIVSRDHIASRLWVAGNGNEEEELLLMPNTNDKKQSTIKLAKSPTFVASAGCAADCEALKRDLQMDLRAASYFGETTSANASPDQVATLLSQVLYSRRNFPYYSFCIVAGLDCKIMNNEGGGAQVYVYDAIGSFEQVAVASTGTGNHLLQPILDSQFRTAATKQVGTTTKNAAAIMTTTTVPTHVDCSAEEACSILINAYRSVSEREIGVGDSLVLCVLQRNEQGQVECQVTQVPLKQH